MSLFWTLPHISDTWMIPYYCLFRCIIRYLKTKCKIPNFIVWIFVLVAIWKKKRQPSLFSFRIATTTKKLVCHIWYLAFGFSHYMMQWNKHINITKSHVDSLFANMHLRHKVHSIRSQGHLNSIKVDFNRMPLTALKQTERSRNRKDYYCQSFCDYSTEPDS